MKDTEQPHSERMIEELRGAGCINSDSLADAFRAVPRHLFLPGLPLDRVYAGSLAIPTHHDENGISISSSSAPNIVAVMLEQLSVEPGHRVLEVGAGTGYNAGLMAYLVGDSGSVVSIDINPEVAREAVDHLHASGIAKVDVIAADGWLGVPRGPTFDRIIATVEMWDISPHWVDQLSVGGLLVLPLWLRPGVHAAVAFEKTATDLVSRSLAYCGFMPFRGPHAGPGRRAIVPGWVDRGQGVTDEAEWVAVFDDASPGRADTLRALLRTPVTRVPTPPLVAGWNVRLALEEPDPITFIGKTAVWNGPTGLFNAERGSLAVVDGVSIHGFGDRDCLDRLVMHLEMSVPLASEDLRITAVSRDGVGRPRGDVVLARPNFDLVVSGLFEPFP